MRISKLSVVVDYHHVNISAFINGPFVLCKHRTIPEKRRIEVEEVGHYCTVCVNSSINKLLLDNNKKLFGNFYVTFKHPYSEESREMMNTCSWLNKLATKRQGKIVLIGTSWQAIDYM